MDAHAVFEKVMGAAAYKKRVATREAGFSQNRILPLPKRRMTTSIKVEVVLGKSPLMGQCLRKWLEFVFRFAFFDVGEDGLRLPVRTQAAIFQKADRLRNRFLIPQQT